jgi:NADPH2:quinone reductase
MAMKAVVLPAHGGPEAFRIEERAAPAPGPGEIVVANEAVGLNFIDVYQRQGLYPVSLPAVLGAEGAGRVAAAGKGAAFREGERVAYLSGGGGYAQMTLVSAGMAAALPDDVDAARAAASFLKGLTAEMLARDVFALKAGHVALVHAAAGGVGTLLVQRAAGLGARVIAVVGAAEKADVARRAPISPAGSAS